MKSYEWHYDESNRLRAEFWKTQGEVDKNVLSFLINPAFSGGPKWPSLRQAFLMVRTQTTTLLASEGLSDPFDDMETNSENSRYNGYGLEFYVEGEESFASVDAAKNSFLFDLVNQMSQFAASKGNIVNILSELKYVTTELYHINVPKEWQNEQGRVGVILGLKNQKIPSTVNLSIEPIHIVNIKLLTLRELAYAAENEAKGRLEIVTRLEKQGAVTVSSIKRESVI